MDIPFLVALPSKPFTSPARRVSQWFRLHSNPNSASATSRSSLGCPLRPLRSLPTRFFGRAFASSDHADHAYNRPLLPLLSMADWAALKAKRARRPPPTPPVIPSHLAPSVSPPAPTPEHDQSDHSAACGCGSAPPPPDASVREENAYADLPPSLEVRRVEGRGRGVFAKRGLKAGTGFAERRLRRAELMRVVGGAGSTLLATAPLVSVLDNYNLGRRCGYCFTKKLGGGGTGELLQCSACKVVRYCSSVRLTFGLKGRQGTDNF